MFHMFHMARADLGVQGNVAFAKIVPLSPWDELQTTQV
jgi:hypothetical protein